jgi:hypothetical protein
MPEITTTTTHPILEYELEGTPEELMKQEADALEQLSPAPVDMQPEDWLPDWYLRKWKETEEMEKVIKEQAKRMINQLKARRQALQWRFGGKFQSVVTARIEEEGGKKKSVNYFAGKAGYRRSPEKIIVNDEEHFLNWYDEQPDEIKADLSSAIRRSVRKTPILEYVRANGDLPGGCDFEESHDKFYPTTDIPQLED